MLPVLPGVPHATRLARAAASVVHIDSGSNGEEQLQLLAAAGAAADPVLEARPTHPPPLVPLLTQEATSAAAGATIKQAGLSLLSRAGVSTALRTAMHVVGDRTALPPCAVRSWLAERYIHNRIVVDQHTASAVLYEAFSQSRVFILRNFPGVLPAVRATVADALSSPPPEESRVYSYNSSGSRVHYMLTTRLTDTPETHDALAWWSNVNQLPDTGQLAGLTSGVLWNFISRRAGSLLHLDDADATCSQQQGKKLWVMVEKEEAAKQGIVPIHVDVMRDDPTGVHRFMSWQQCASFQWCILEEGETLVLPRNRLHAVYCIGDVDSVGAGMYCWLAGTPSPLAAPSTPKKGRKRKHSAVARSPSPALPPKPLSIISERSARQPIQPLARAALATLVADGQPLTVAAFKAGASQSSAQRWSKRARTAGSTSDAPRSGRPRATDAATDAAIVEASEKDPFMSTRAIQHQLQLSVCNNTVNQRLDEAGLPSRIAAHKRHYTDAQRRARLSFAHGYRHWTEEDWESVIMADQKTFEGAGRDRQQRVRRPDGHRFDEKYTKHRVLYAPSIHVTCCICSRGPGRCAVYEGKLDGTMLKNMLDKTIVQTARDYFDVDRAERWWFLHDNSPVFKSSVVQRWVHNKGIQLIDFPPYSPDVNIIENFWPRVSAVMDKAEARTPAAVEAAFHDAWNDIPLDIYIDYAHSMPKRIAAIIEANGNATKY